ncbi:MAG: ABC transporter ATP-binding protein [Lachnospiraceae bacterium]|nr:ABC transporter ATP-binding protein [Lachnospiraceae bacterium]
MLKIEGITKLYDAKHGIKNIKLEAYEGDVISFIGPNGAGKTTLVKCIAGLLYSQKGKISLNELDVLDRNCKRKIGYMEESLNFYYDMTIYELLDFIYKIKYRSKNISEVDGLLNDFNLYSERNRLVKLLSVGMKRKLSIIIALLGSPQLVILDEPTNGIDTSGLMFLKRHIKLLSQRGSIIILTSHVLDFVESISKKCIFLDEGQIAKEICAGELNLEEEYEKLYLLPPFSS